MNKIWGVIAVLGYVVAILCLWNQQKSERVAVDDSCERPKFIRDAAPSWTTIHVDGFFVDIPYSSEWRVESPWCLWEGAHYDPQIYSVMDWDSELETQARVVAFGRPTNNLTNIDDEYHLSRRSAASSFNPGMITSWSCLSEDIATPAYQEVGAVTGTRYFQGGAKWCDMVFQFFQDGYEYTLRRNLEPGTSNGLSDSELAEIDEEMQRIILSIREEKF